MEEIIKKVCWYDRETHSYQSKDVRTGKFKFTDEDRMQIVSEYVQGHVPASKIVEKYNLGGRQLLFNWMDKFVNEKELVSLPNKQSEDPMAKKNPDERIRELEAENKRLEKALELEKLRAKAYDTMINVAEETFNIPIRKKSGTKQ